ncbi:MAG TPA: alpha/beta hydrolase [Leptolyngbyaceae cyanobacterium M33_DOE_097]|uniref:Alpha/beta hydrolase n=1 Tax=Oscillatoriales cyanobacterium SpSt-418 TaxID=2282169 RepID=A0A7C3PJK1_9CYAN|nr:alpha/beta hydrolase [Leptolyngbyaceae cyanobacterium M33_DOE_097]
MLNFHPPGIGQKTVKTSLGSMVYYTPVGSPWQITGSDRQPLLFLHNFGGGASAYEWSKVYPAFLDDYHVLAPDLLGWGSSDHPVRDYRIEDYLLTLQEFIEKTCAVPPIAVCSSFTGAISVRLAVQHPHLFRALILTCPSGFSDFGQDAGRRLPLQVIGMPFLDQTIYNLGAMNAVAVRNFLERFLFADSSRVASEMVDAYLASASQPNAQYSALAFLRGDLYFDLARYLPQLSVPAFFLWGKQAQFTPLALAERLATLTPLVKSCISIDGAGVLPHLEQPEAVIGLLHQFLPQC